MKMTAWREQLQAIEHQIAENWDRIERLRKTIAELNGHQPETQLQESTLLPMLQHDESLRHARATLFESKPGTGLPNDQADQSVTSGPMLG
jgi:hypothetical protein